MRSLENWPLLVAFVVGFGMTVVSGATLDGLTPSVGTLTPALAPGTTTYSVSVPNADNTITFTPDYSATTSSGVLAGTAVAELTASHVLNLPDGTNTFNFVLTDVDNTTTTYTLTVIRAPVLTNLVLSAGTLAPAFASGTGSYGASVAGSVNTMTITPTSDPANGVTLTVDGTAVASGVASSGVDLNEGTTVQGGNTSIAVVASNVAGSVTYTVLVHRGPSDVAKMTDLSPSSGVLDPTPQFNVYSYTISVANAIANMAFTPQLMPNNPLDDPTDP